MTRFALACSVLLFTLVGCSGQGAGIPGLFGLEFSHESLEIDAIDIYVIPNDTGTPFTLDGFTPNLTLQPDDPVTAPVVFTEGVYQLAFTATGDKTPVETTVQLFTRVDSGKVRFVDSIQGLDMLVP